MMVSFKFKFYTFTNVPVIKVQRKVVKLKFDKEEKIGQYKYHLIPVQENLLLKFNEYCKTKI